MRFDHCAAYAALYHQEMRGFPPEDNAYKGLCEQGREALPVIAFVHFPKESDSAEALEGQAKPFLDRAEQLVGWVSGDNLTEFAFLIATEAQAYFRLTPPHSHRRLLLGPGNVGEALKRNIDGIKQAADADERFELALSMYRDALHEKNKLFKIARLFSVLESLAYALISDDVRSRKAIRTMLGLENGAVGEVAYDGRRVRYERIELAGRLRDRVFHGAHFRREDLNSEWRDSFDLLTDRPDDIASALKSDCELELARWGNGTSKARTAAIAKRDGG